MTLPEYLSALAKLHASATEHSYSGAIDGNISSVGISQMWSNDQQYFADVPESTWGTSIGGYQPVQKWLKDRVGRQLTFDDIRHYQRMIVALTETGKCMEEVDKIGVV